MDERTRPANRLRPRALRRQEIRPKRWLPVSPAQRVKVIESPCLVCGRNPVDAAHLVPQRLGGCAAPDCVVPLCRTHHRLFDCGLLALGLYLDPEFGAELGHALGHVSRDELDRALVQGWPAPWEDNKDEGDWQ
jgi:hypothetical protein